MSEIKVVDRHQWTHDGDRVLILKVVDKDLCGFGGFQYPTSGEVVAPDWDPTPECGGGLHGWPWGFGLGEGKSVDFAAPWIVLAADPVCVVSLGGKVKCERAEVVCVERRQRCGDGQSASAREPLGSRPRRSGTGT